VLHGDGSLLRCGVGRTWQRADVVIHVVVQCTRCVTCSLTTAALSTESDLADIVLLLPLDR